MRKSCLHKPDRCWLILVRPLSLIRMRHFFIDGRNPERRAEINPDDAFRVAEEFFTQEPDPTVRDSFSFCAFSPGGGVFAQVSGVSTPRLYGFHPLTRPTQLV